MAKNASPRIWTNTLRLWRNAKSVVIGRFQCARLEVDLEACNRLGIDVLRRFSGGGTVYHDLGNLNYSINVRKDSLVGVASQSQFFDLLLQGVVESLSSLGVSASPEASRGIWMEGKKLSGIAGFTSRVSYFGHGTLLVNSNLEHIRRILRPAGSRDPRGPVRSIPSPVINLSTLMGSQVSIETIKEALVSGVEKVFRCSFVTKGTTLKETQLAEKLYEQRCHYNACSPCCPVIRCISLPACPYKELKHT